MKKALHPVSDRDRGNTTFSYSLHQLLTDLVTVPVIADGMQIIQIKDHAVELLRGPKRKNIVFADGIIGLKASMGLASVNIQTDLLRRLPDRLPKALDPKRRRKSGPVIHI